MITFTAARFSNSPVMISAEKAEWASQSLAPITAGAEQIQARMSAEQQPVMLEDGFWPPEDHWLSAYRPYKVVDGTLMVPVRGMLLHDFPYALGGWATGYDYIVRAFERGMEDGSVQRIAMMLDSPGGEVAGCFDAADKVFAMRGTKPIQAFVNESAYSAAYAWATVADKISMTRTAGVGSIGVVTAHMDVSGAMEKAGLKITFIHAGDHKVDGNPYQGLPDEVKARIQARINSMYTIFTSTAARNLGIEESAVIATQARTYGADEAVALGLAHEVLALDEALAAFSGELENPAGDDDVEFTPEQEKAIAQREAAARAEGTKEGASAEQARIKGILASDEATGRTKMAMHLALGTNQSVADAAALLAVSPQEQATAAPAAKTTGADFTAAMDENNPNLGAGDGGDDKNQAKTTHDEFLAATGYGSQK